MSSTFMMLFLSWILLATAQVNFPCDQIPSGGDYSCSDVGFCYYDHMTAGCAEDACVEITTESAGCPGSGCNLRYRDYDYDCATLQYVNKTGWYCVNNYNSINTCFYNFLKNGSCGSGCKLETLQGKSACIDDYTSPPPGTDPCNEYTSDECEIVTSYCFVQNGKCVTDVCRDSGISWSGSDCPLNTTCVGKDRYDWDGTTVTSSKVCLDPNHTNYDKCSNIDIYDYVPTGVGLCTNVEQNNERCTGQSGCKVITFKGDTFCSSLDPPSSSSSVVRIPFFLTFLVMAVLAFSFSV